MMSKIIALVRVSDIHINIGDRSQVVSETHKRSIISFIRNECANYYEGNCELLGDYEHVPCLQLESNRLICKYFRDAVLSLDKLLHAQIMGHDCVRGCEVCGKLFRAVNNRAKYCEHCSKEMRKNRQRKYMQEKRLNA